MPDTIVMLRQLSADDQIRQEAHYREKRLHDEATALGHARREGIEKGRAEGRAEGRMQGRAEERSYLTELMRKKGYTEEQIKDLLGSQSE